jgi:hypothetical protein
MQQGRNRVRAPSFIGSEGETEAALVEIKSG